MDTYTFTEGDPNDVGALLGKPATEPTAPDALMVLETDIAAIDEQIARDIAESDGMVTMRIFPGENRSERVPDDGTRFVHVAEFMQRPAPEYIVERIIPSDGFALIYGASGSGKTFLALALSRALCTGQSFLGFRTRRAGVAYLCGEGQGGLRNRLHAFVQESGDNPLDWRMQVLPMATNLCRPNGDEIEALIANLHAVRSRVCPGGEPFVVIVDTLNRHLMGGDENSPEDMGAFIASVGRITGALSAVGVAIHHTGKDATKGARGHSSLLAAVDTEILVARDGDMRAFTVTKGKDGGEGEGSAFRLRAVRIGQEVDSFGNARTSCVVEPVAGDHATLTALRDGQRSTAARPLPGPAATAMRALNHLIGEGTFKHATADDWPIPMGAAFVDVEEWRKEFERRHASLDSGDARSPGTIRKDWKRAHEALAKAERIEMRDGRAWVLTAG